MWWLAGHQVITRDWWETRRNHFNLFVSEVVEDEAAQGDAEAAATRLAILEDIQLLNITDDVISFEAIKAHSEDYGYIAPIICTAEELLGEYVYDVERPNR